MSLRVRTYRWVAITVVFCFAVALAAQDKPSKPLVRQNAAVATVAVDGRSPEKASAMPVKSTEPRGLENADQTYRIGVEDDLQISVWHESELSMQVVVRPDGMITMPLLNDIQVVGLTTKQLQDLLTEKLKGYVTEPQVTVIVRGIRSRKVYLVGQVGHTGAFPLNSHMTVLQLLAQAGGLGPFAKGDNIYVIRNQNGSQQKLRFNYKRALKGDSVKEDFELVPGDMVVVP